MRKNRFRIVIISVLFLLPASAALAGWSPSGISQSSELTADYWDHTYPRLANQHFGRSPAEWYARFDLIVAQTSKDLIQATKAIDPSTMFIFTDSVYTVDNGNNMPDCPGWTDEWYAMKSDGSWNAVGNWPITDVSNLVPNNGIGERLNQSVPRCFTQLALNGGYDGVGTDWFFDKPRLDNLDMDRNGQNDYVEHGKNWVIDTWREGAAEFVANWRVEVDAALGPSAPIWINTGLLHDNSRIPGVLENSNGLEFERMTGFTSFNNSWKQYQKWIESGQKPSVWVTDTRPGGSDPYTYARGGHSKNYLELMRMFLAFTLMGDGYFEFNPIEAGEHKYYAYFDEYGVPLGYPIEIGQPGAYDDAQLLANDVMVRFFDNGIVILNPNSFPVTVHESDIAGLEGYDGPYWRFVGGQSIALDGNNALNNGTPFDSSHPISLDGHGFDDKSVGDGILLLKSPMVVVTDIIVDHIDGFTSPGSQKAELDNDSNWENSPGQGNAWAQRQASWQKPEPLYAYRTSTVNAARAAFRPNIGVAGEYEIFEWHPDVSGACTQVPVELVIGGVRKPASTIDQSGGGGRWNSLGTYQLPKGMGSYIEIEAGGGCTTVADAFKFVYRIEEQTAQTFLDVPPDHWAYDYIEALYREGYVSGCSSDPLMYCPESNMTRAESAVFVERGIWGAGYMPDQPAAQIFEDIPLWEWFAKWTAGLFEEGYTAGCGTNPLVYCPLQEHTRVEGAVFFLRMMHGAEYVPPDPAGIFADVDVGIWGAKWAEAAYNAGLIPACETSPELRFCPDDPLDRAMGAYMMVQAKGLSIP
jgi:hypothetical protein